MSDIHTTAFRYDSTCSEMDIKPHPYINKMFEKEKEETVIWANRGDFKENMHLYLAGNNKLLTDRRLADPDCLALYKTLENNLYVVSLDLRYNNITDEGAQHLAKLIEGTPGLQELDLMGNDIGPDGAEHIAKALQTNETLRTLRMTGNKIGNKGGMCFAQALQVNLTLEALDVGDTDMTIESVIAMATVLNQNKTLKALNVNRPILFTHQEETTVHFSKMLKVNRSLEELHLQKYDMRDFGATRLAECLMENYTLTYLDLSCNRITRDGTKELAKVLKKDTALKTLDLGFNRLEDDGALHLADALATCNMTLNTLVIVSNNIASKGLCAIADSMKTNTSLSKVFIWGNKLEEPACIAFANLVETGRLDLTDTDVKPYVVDGVTSLCEQNHHIRRHYYYAPSYGDDVPSWQPPGVHEPRSKEITFKV
ncbi:leucine-rich repeat-containing protein 34-like isoform X1 [Haliotis rufescens]|uniref:leucine-rich repeat-containing protein 34-like isoform X1 n=1 Tax=Haliotis rufescens TaxID=6454 RepID=UPI001EAF9815|nr:leucine-rich repeat-containing protein 34-like isoform X1 [Haliotis rufescens]XP_046343702.2 leucine-rich repeat-containing protein 34-like isoform X1 [Haliotis rufescens]